MTIILYDLCGAQDHQRFSPYCWRARMALMHKGIKVETRPTPFTRINTIADGSHKTVPIIDDGGRVVGDSWNIAVYLEETYPDRPSLFAGEGGRATAKFVEAWAFAVLHAHLMGLIVADINDRLTPEDQVYFRASREQRLGRRLEEVQAGREVRHAAFLQALQPLRAMLASQPFIGGATPLYADYIVFGSLQWPRVVSPFPLLPAGDPVTDWFERCLDLFDGYARAMPAAV